MSNDPTDPGFLQELEQEANFLNAKRAGNRAERLEFKDVGEGAVVRVLPYPFDDRHRWYARIAQHWVNKRPYVCTRDTDPAHGGHPEGKCAICDLCAELNNDKSESVRKEAYRAMAVTRYLVYVLVYERQPAHGEPIKTRPADLRPVEFWMYKEGFSDLSMVFKTYLRRTDSKLSIVDPSKGCDVLVTKARRGLRFEREPEPFSIAPSGQDAVEYLEKILKNTRFKPDATLDGRDLDDLLLKLEDSCFNRRSVSSSSRGDSRSGDVDEDSHDRRGDRNNDGRDDRGDRSDRGRDSSRGDERGSDRAPSSDRGVDRGLDRERGSEPERSTRRADPEPVRRREAEPVRSSRREDLPPSREVDPLGDRRRVDELPADDGSEDPPPPISRSVTGSRRDLTPPPAAVNSAPRDTGHAEEEEDLPPVDRDTAPAAAPAAGEVINDAARSSSTPASRGTGLTESISSRIRSRSARP